tara:strand:+ start:233 stop:1027 length:795 start_codon:yes stop_codon:yes gene_type:complete
MEKPIQLYFRTVERQETNMAGRPEWFSYEKCWDNLLRTINSDLVDINVIIDTEKERNNALTNEMAHRVEMINSKERLDSLLKDYNDEDIPSVFYKDRDPETGKEYEKREEPPDREKASGQMLYEIIQQDNLSDNQIVYIVEDDYLHLPQWTEIIMDFYQKHGGLHYISLYDHGDKYTQRYTGLVSNIFLSGVLHWRTIPSTCGTWAAPALALKEDYDIHHGRLGDHNKWMKLQEKNRAIVSCIPGRATHCMEGFTSPFVDWSTV